MEPSSETPNDRWRTWVLLFLTLLVIAGLLYWSLGRRGQSRIAPLSVEQQALADQLLTQGSRYAPTEEQRALAEEVLSNPTPPELSASQRATLQKIFDR